MKTVSDSEDGISDTLEHRTASSMLFRVRPRQAARDVPQIEFTPPKRGRP
ncbi:MAG: hypothetical protein AAGG44_01950 [Planctomycetota bacterium]